jgi:hypothetical protein
MVIRSEDFQSDDRRAGGGSTRASAIKPRRIRWAWRGRLPLGYMAIQSGESSLGKSTQACATVAGLTHGRLEGHLEGEPARVLIVANEDAREDVWVPRLTVAGADLDQIDFQDQGDEWNLRDGMKLTGRLLAETGAKFVFVDSVMEHLPDPQGGENVNSTTFVRRALRPFADLCKSRQVAGLISTHPPKSKGSTFADMVIASAAFVHMCRVGLLFAWHPDDLDLDEGDRRRVLMRPPGGSNIGRNPGTFEFRVLAKTLLIEDELEEVPYTTPLAPSNVSFRDLTRTPRDEPPARPQIADAKLLIEQRLSDDQWHPSMVEELVEQGFKKTTAYDAAVGIRKKQSPNGGWWWASADAPEPDFVQLDRNPGSARARARSNSDGGIDPPKTPDNGSVETSSAIPADLDETPESSPPEGSVPLAEAGRARAREAGDEADEYAARFRRDQAEGRWDR